MTTPEPAWEDIKLAVAEAMEQAPPDRVRFLETHCAGNGALLREAVSLVEAASADSGVLSQRVDRWLEVGVPDTAGLAGHRIGRYTLVRVIGDGASGVVYLAEQENPARTVAVKVVRSPLPLVDVSGRFRLEAAALGRIRHPNVAQIYEAGVYRMETGSSLPYLAMEYIDGVPITSYAKQANLSTRAILLMMARVCEAVHAAHQRAVIHRDLKPSNVLVDHTGEPKVLDFGIARIDAEGFQTRMTAAGSLLGTPAYMSPERLFAEETDADVRTDVWSLGALLYELLTGRPPFEASGGTSPVALQRLVEAGVTPIRKLKQTIGRDLECVVMTALAYDREHRYASAEALADDLGRVAAGQAISARTPGRAERAIRFVRRHRAGVTVAVAFVTVLIVSLVTMGVMATRTIAERDRARAVVGLLRGMISEADPNFGSRGITVLEALRSLESRLSDRLGEQPATEAEVRSLLGSLYFSIAEYGPSRVQLERAIEVRSRLGDHAGRLDDQIRLANTLRWLYMPEEARRLISETRSESMRRLGATHPTTIHASEVLAGCSHDEGRLAESESAYRAVIDASARSLGAAAEQTLFARSGLASVLIDAGRYSEAESELRGVIATREASEGHMTREMLTLRANLAIALAEQGRLSDAIAQQRRLADDSAVLLGPLHDSTLSTRMNLAESLRRTGDAEQALEINRQLLSDCAAAFGHTHENTIDAVEAIAMNLVRMERADEAEQVVSLVLAEVVQARGAESDAALRLQSTRASIYSALGRPGEAEKLYLDAIQQLSERYGPDDSRVLVWTNNLGTTLIDSGRFSEAVRLFRELLAVAPDRYESMRPVFQRNLGRALLGIGQSEEARTILEEARRASLERGELDNAQRCESLLNQIAAGRDPDSAARPDK